MAFYLAMKEIWRTKGRFFLFSLVIALITVLVLFIAALADGLANANKEYLEKLNANLIVFQENVDLSTTGSRISWDKLNDLRRITEIADLGPVGFSSATIVFNDGSQPLDVALIGAEPGKPGMPPIATGSEIRSSRGNQTIIDGNVAQQSKIKIGDKIILKTTQGTQEEFTTLTVVGTTDKRQYLYQPSIFVNFNTWEKIRPQAGVFQSSASTFANIIAITTANPSNLEETAQLIETQVGDVEVVDLVTAYEATPGYQAQQSTLNTQCGFTLLIGILVIGGFFQIQTLQKVPQIGVLKAIGTSSHSVAVSVVLQIIIVTIVGVVIGTIGTFALTLLLPTGIPFVFTGSTAMIAIASLLLIGPIGGMVSVRLALKVEPLRALGM
ncbi:MAG: ABC transporter permease [Anaerolineales bacterium]